MKILDEYNLKARIFPVLVASFPIVLFIQERFIGEMSSLKELLEFEVVGETSFLLVVLWFISMLNREFSKVLEKHYYGDPRVFPTTYLMLFSDNTLSDEIKENYRRKINCDFNTKVPSREDELNDIKESKKLLGEIAQLVLDSCRKDALLFKHNIWYGFWRNLTSAVLIVFPFVLTIITYDFYKREISMIQVCFLIVSLIIIIFHKRLWKANAERFARKLFSIYLAS